jgi:hypothetical protein
MSTTGGIPNRAFSHKEVNTMKLTQNLGMFLLSIWLIVTGALQIVTIYIPAIGIVLPILTIITGVVLLLAVVKF